MRNSSLPAEVRTRLLRAGFSRAYANRAARELHEHWSEIVDEGLASGLTQIQAEQEASNRLGPSGPLAAEFIARLQKSFWLGRNPTFAFGMLALTLTILWWILIGSAAAQFGGLFSKSSTIGTSKFDRLSLYFDWVRTISYVAVPWLCCHIAERFFCGWRPALWACLVIAIHNAAHFFELTGSGDHGNVKIGYGFSMAGPALLPILAPLAVFALHRAWMMRDEFNSKDSGPTFC